MKPSPINAIVFVDLHDGTKLRKEFPDVDEWALRLAVNAVWARPSVKRVTIAVKGN